MGAFKPVKQCKVCAAVKADKGLFRRIYASKAYVKGGESLRSISEDTGIRYLALTTHVKKHQHITDDKLAESALNEIAKAEGRKQVAKLVRTADARQTAIDRLFTKLENGEFDSDMSVKDLLRALKDADDVSAKKKDQDIDILRMMGGVRSGEVPSATQYEEFDPWAAVEEGEVVGPQ